MLKRTFVTLVAFLLTYNAEGKCGNSTIAVRGVIVGSKLEAGGTLFIRVAPDTNWEPQPPISVDGKGNFSGIVYFDRTISGGAIHNCSRTPESVTVELQKDGRTIDKVSLHIKKDFIKVKPTNYEVRSPVVLHWK